MILNLILTAVIVMQYILHYRERKDLYNRIMAQNLKEYKAIEDNKKITMESAHRRAINKWRTGGEKV